MRFFAGHYLPVAGQRGPRASPLRRDTLAGLPRGSSARRSSTPRDEGEAYADALKRAGVEVAYSATRHGARLFRQGRASAAANAARPARHRGVQAMLSRSVRSGRSAEPRGARLLGLDLAIAQLRRRDQRIDQVARAGATSGTARLKASSLASTGGLNPESLRTNCNDEAWICSWKLGVRRRACGGAFC